MDPVISFSLSSTLFDRGFFSIILLNMDLDEKKKKSSEFIVDGWHL